jgi:predicted ribosomally synthesized peptide with SipW-like signal peptide
MKKTLLLSAASVAGAAALVASMTFAAFNDYEDVAGPSIAAGTIELDQWGDPAPWPITISNMAPGDSVSFPVKLENEGTLNGTLYGKVDSIIGIEDGCDVRDLDPGQWYDPALVEAVVDPDCGNPWSQGDLMKYLTVELTGPGIAAPIDLMNAGPKEFLLTGLKAHATATYWVTVTFVNEALPDVYTIAQQNDAQGDGVCITLKFALVADAPQL